MTVVLIEKEIRTQTGMEGGIREEPREEHHVKTGVIQPQDKQHMGLLEVGKDK